MFFIKVKKHVFYVFYLQSNVFNIYGMWVKILTVMMDRIGSVSWWIVLDWIYKNGPMDISVPHSAPLWLCLCQWVVKMTFVRGGELLTVSHFCAISK